MTILFSSPIFGPVHSRRLGVSLGINLMPSDGKICNFDCIYCECGFNDDYKTKSRRPTRQEVKEKLIQKLEEMGSEGVLPDVLTFAGNGEPTAHPHFDGIIDDTIEVRDKYCPNAKVSVLSNATLINRPKVFEALCKVDNNILKLDTVNEDFIHAIDRPTAHYPLQELIEKMKEFNGKCIIQTMFLTGEYQGKQINNTTDEFVNPWIETVKYIAPEQVMIYTIDRETPAHQLKKATHEQLDAIGKRLEAIGIKVSVSY